MASLTFRVEGKSFYPPPVSEKKCQSEDYNINQIHPSNSSSKTGNDTKTIKIDQLFGGHLEEGSQLGFSNQADLIGNLW